MSLTALARELIDATSETAREAERRFIEAVTFAEADEILAMLHTVIEADWMGLPPWARNLSYRLACLQRPDDADLLREAGVDLHNFGPDWDDIAEGLERRADELDLRTPHAMERTAE